MGKGGGGSAAPQQTSSNVYQTNIPEYAQPYVQNMLNATQAQLFNTDSSGNITGFNQYQPYTGMDQQALQNASQAVAGFSPLQQQAQSSAANLQTPGQYNQAMGATGMGIMGSLGAGRQYQQMATNPYAMQAYMNPYVQASLAPQLQLLGQQTGIQSAAQQGAATSAGAFGGSRSALQNALTQQSGQLAAQQAIGQGYNQAYNNAMQNMQFGANLGLQGYNQAISGAGQLGNLAGQQLGAQTNILNTQNTLGAQQQANAQQIINQGIQNYATAQQYPLMELGTMSNMLRGLPMQSATTQQYQAAPTALAQGVGAAGTAAMLSSLAGASGGLPSEFKKVKGYLGGGIIDATKSDLEDMPTDALQKELETTDSQTIKKQINGILQARAVAPGHAGGGIVAFADNEEGETAGEAADRVTYGSAQDVLANLKRNEQMRNAASYQPMVDAESAGLAARFPAPVQENPEAVAKGYKDAAVMNAQNNPEAITAVPAVVPTPTSRYAAMGTPTSRFGDTNQVVPAERTAADIRSGKVTAAPAMGTAQATRAGINAVPVSAPVTAPAVQAGATQDAEDAQLGIKGAQPTANSPVVQQKPAAPKADPHAVAEKTVYERAVKNADNPSKVFGIELPGDKYMDNYLAAKEKYVGASTATADIAAQEARRHRAEISAKDRDKMIMAMGFAKMATTPGSFIVAGMTGLQQALPQLIASRDKRDETMEKIDDAIANIRKADRMERASDFEAAHKYKQEGLKNYLDAYKIYADYTVGMAKVGADYARVNQDKNAMKVQGLLEKADSDHLRWQKDHADDISTAGIDPKGKPPETVKIINEAKKRIDEENQRYQDRRSEIYGASKTAPPTAANKPTNTEVPANKISLEGTDAKGNKQTFTFERPKGFSDEQWGAYVRDQMKKANK